MGKFSSYEFSHAIVRKPGLSVAKGLRDNSIKDPDPETFKSEHAGYVSALRQAGVDVTELEPLEGFPDSVFIEDPVLCIKGTAIVLRPGAQSRFGERDTLRDTLKSVFARVIDLPEGGFVDGGDILVTEREVLIGLSARTDLAGAELLKPIVSDLGMSLRIAQTPAEILHFKTECGLLDENTIFATKAILKSGCFADYEVIECPEGEEAAANLIRVNSAVLLSAGFSETAALLRTSGYQVIELPTTQAALVDGGLSCMSLRFTSDV